MIGAVIEVVVVVVLIAEFHKHAAIELTRLEMVNQASHVKDIICMKLVVQHLSRPKWEWKYVLMK